MDTFELPEAMAAEIIEHAFAEYPRECCGIISGPDGKPAKLTRMTNVDPNPIMRYRADDHQVLEMYNENNALGWDVVCIYHSHTHSPASPSPTDVESAFEPEAVYALVSLAERQAPDLRAFRILDGTITEVRVVRTSEAVPKGS